VATLPVLICSTPLLDNSSIRDCARASREFINLEVIYAGGSTPLVSELAEYFSTGLSIPLTIFLSVKGIAMLVDSIQKL